MQRIREHSFFKSHRRLTVPLLIAFIIAGFIPFETSVVPLWKIKVVDSSGNPLGGIGVRQVWQDYSTESSSHEQDLITDSNGYVIFPARSVKAGLLRRLVYPIINLLSGAHASWGASSWVIVLVKDASKESGSARWSSDESLPEVIMVKSF
jgi:hypothetical protein